MGHSRIADLAASFPALLFALTVPRPGLDPACACARDRWPRPRRGGDGRRPTSVAAKAASGGADASDFATARRRTFSSTDREPPSALSLAHNRSRLWSVRRNGERVATLRIACRYRDPLLNIVELKSAGNADVPRELWWAARQWLHMHDLLQKAALTGELRRSIARPGCRCGVHTGLHSAAFRNGCRSARRATRSSSYDGCHLRQCAAMSARLASHTLGWLASQSRTFANPKARPGCAMMRL
jgi:hypothetical protein